MATQKQKITKYILVGLALLILGAIGYRIYQIQKEKQDFAKAEQRIDALAQQIEQLIGKPDEIKKEKTCGRANRVYAEGPLGCSVYTNLIYENRGLAQANDILARLKALVGGPVYNSLGLDEGVEFSDKKTYSLTQEIGNLGSVYCSSRYSHEQNKLHIELSCGGQVISQYYPLKN